jgi:hypothetical protein
LVDAKKKGVKMLGGCQRLLAIVRGCHLPRKGEGNARIKKEECGLFEREEDGLERSHLLPGQAGAHEEVGGDEECE